MNVTMHLSSQTETKVRFFEKTEEREEFYNLNIRDGIQDFNIIATKEELQKIKEAIENVNL